MKIFNSILLIGLAPLFMQTARAETITVSAAISLKEAMIDANVAFQKLTGDDVQFSFGASGTLLTQIKNGAPVDGFISAAADQIDALEKLNLGVKESRRVVATNELVMIVPAASTLKLTSIADLAKPEVKKIAVGQPKAVPAGQYAMQTLTALKLNESLAVKIVNGENVRQVLDYVVRGEVDAGFVYATDAHQVGARVTVIATAPAEAHDPIVYPGELIASSKKLAIAQKFFDFLASADGQKILLRHGFITDAPKPATRPTESHSSVEHTRQGVNAVEPHVFFGGWQTLAAASLAIQSAAR